MTILLQPLQRAITEGTWTGLDVARGYWNGGALTYFLNKNKTKKNILTLLFCAIDAAVIAKRVNDFKLGGPYNRVFQISLFGLTALNAYIILYPQNKIQAAVSFKILNYTKKLHAIAYIILTVFEYRKKPVQTAVSFAMYGVWGIAYRSSLIKKPVVGFGLFGTSMLARAWIAHKGEPFDRIMGVTTLLLLGGMFTGVIRNN